MVVDRILNAGGFGEVHIVLAAHGCGERAPSTDWDEANSGLYMIRQSTTKLTDAETSPGLGDEPQITVWVSPEVC